jgi:type IV fimbrial biogenesis protein FimT
MRKYQVGFTIIELMVTLVVLAVLIAMVAPAFNSLIQRNTSTALGEEFVTALNFARSEAIKRRAPVSICASNDAGTSCGDDWSNGWIVFIDEAAETATDYTFTAAKALRFWNDINRNAEITVKRNAVAINFVRFAGMGVLARNNSAPIVASLQYADCTGDAARTVSIGLSGMVNSRSDLCVEASNEEAE